MMERHSETPFCSRCGSSRTARVKRVGFLQRFVFQHLGLYPWECALCRSVFVFKTRGKLKRKRQTAGEMHLPPIHSTNK